MTKYRVPVRISFDGAVSVEAKDESEAEELACYYVGAVIGHVSDGCCDRILDYEFDTHGDTELRDNESIEELEEDEDEDEEEE